MSNSKIPVVFLLLPLLLLACSLTATPLTPAGSTPASIQSVLPLPDRSTQPSPTPTRCIVIADALNLRECAGTSCTVKAWLKLGEALSVHQNVDGWFQVTTPAGESGWVNSKYCGGL